MNKRYFIFLTLFISTLLFAGCATEEDPEELETMSSDIEPAVPFISGLQRIALQTPLDGDNTVTLGTTSLTYNASEPTYAALFIFTALPQQENGHLLLTNCIAGVTSLNPAHASAWNDYTVLLSDNVTGTDLYTCDSSNSSEPLTDTKTILTSGTYYWLILGYNKNYELTHSSDSRSFTIP